jgi:hypothetical protein
MEKPRPHICRTCDRSFTRLEHLKRHVRSHTKEKPFSCPHCASCFARRDLLLRHRRKLHQPVASSSTPRGARQEVITGLPPNITGPSKIADRTWKISVAGSVSGAADISRESKRPRMGYVGVTTLGAFNELLWSRDASLAMNGEGYPDHSQHIGLNQSCVFDHRLMSTFLNRERQARPLPTSAAHLWDGCSGLQAVSSRGCGCDEFGWKGTFASSSSIVTPDQPHCLEANYKADRAVRKPPFLSSSLRLLALTTSDVDLCGSAGLRNSTSLHSAYEAAADGSFSSTIDDICQRELNSFRWDGSGHPTLAAVWQDLSDTSFDDAFSPCL